MACYFPFKVENPNWGRIQDAPPTIPVPCGKCPYCLQRRANNWVFRCMVQSRTMDGVWLTLTYDNDHIPLSGSKLPTLNKSDYQLFMKRLRSSYRPGDPPVIKYYACGEYGSQTYRPHFHAVLFGCTDRERIQRAWHYGIVHFDDINERTVAYTAKYMNKGKLIPMFEADDRIPEFQLFSKGLGANYLTDNIIEYHKQDPEKNNYVMVDGFKKPLPRYFANKIFNDEEKLLRSAYAQKQAEETYTEQYGEYQDYRILSKSKTSNLGATSKTFEEWRYERKRNAVDDFRRNLRKRNKL